MHSGLKYKEDFSISIVYFPQFFFKLENTKTCTKTCCKTPNSEIIFSLKPGGVFAL